MEKGDKFKVRKFSVSSITSIFLIIFCVICLSTYCILAYYENRIDTMAISASALPEGQGKADVWESYNLALVKTIKDVLLVLLSITGTNLLISVLIEKNSKNKLIETLFCEDILSSPEFYKRLNTEDRTQLVQALFSQHYFEGKKMLQNMHDSILQKLQISIGSGYYFSKCSYDVTCFIKDGYFEKHTERTVHIASYGRKMRLRSYCVGKYSSKSVNGIQGYEFKALSINGKPVSKDLLKIDTVNLTPQNETNDNCDIRYEVTYLGDLELSDCKDLIITACYITRTSRDDINSVFRASKPCRSFYVQYRLQGPESDQHQVIGNGFGFVDDAVTSPPTLLKTEKKMAFNDWVFQDDGVVITFL